jgi:hypothetical protein
LGAGLTTPPQKRITVTKPSDEPSKGGVLRRRLKLTPGCNAKEEEEEEEEFNGEQGLQKSANLKSLKLSPKPQ